MAAGARMWESKMFTKEQMVEWENKPTIDQIWANLQACFTEKWLKCHQYSSTTAKHSQFREVVLSAQEQAADKEEGEMQAMMSMLLQEQHLTKLEGMAAANRVAIETLLEHMNAIVGTSEKNTNKESMLPTGNNSGTAATKRSKKKCNNCGKMVFHKLEVCYELDANADKRWVVWKSSKVEMTP
jgi:hypothetical protein